ncbi:hypothetical protein [Tropicimonas sp. IMCC34043]|uniref:hypothetical protein n=1 Tax=Tropicimonas sp. IMCC34043 TaxID=2248760 RepID=UPI000E23887D|nr:hypothetical protein [Tropicimonas sp. IMCC34043]
MKDLVTPELVRPTRPAIESATIDALGRLKGVDLDAARTLPKTLEASSAPVLQATANIIHVVIYGDLTVRVQTDPYKHFEYHVSSWGLGTAGGTALGFMYTAYNSWEAFFANVTSYHVQGIAEGRGILQVTWFTPNGSPVGQFNGAMPRDAGIECGIEGGGPGKWKNV